MITQSMISVEEARERILAYFQRLDAEDRPVLDALGQVLAEDVVAQFDIPPLANTAMDGYAVRAADELPAGRVFDGEVAPGTAVRIMTGAPIPRGADAVVPFEETDEASTGRAADVGIMKAARPGANVRRAAEDVARGATALRAGTAR